MTLFVVCVFVYFIVWAFMLSSVDILFILVMLSMIMMATLYYKTWFHIMFLLMLLEFIMLNNYLTFMLMASITGSMMFIFVFVTLSVAEASVGLSLLTALVRSQGVDYLGVQGL